MIKKSFHEERKKYSTSKTGIIISWTSSIILSIIIAIGVFFTEKDMAVLATVCCASWVETGVYDAVYAKKTERENKAKYAQYFVEKMADKYGIENITNLINSVIQN